MRSLGKKETAEKKGILYGVGTGPGDPELMTLKAVRILKECDMLLLPAGKKEDCRAYRIAAAAVPEIKDKPFIGFEIPMTRDEEIRNKAFRRIHGEISGYLMERKTLAFLTIGDPAVYSTFCYLADEAKRAGDEVRMISGITSFSACSARAVQPLAEGPQEIHIIPSESDYDEALKLPGTKVFMKAGGRLKELKEKLTALPEGSVRISAVENCGMENERVYEAVKELPEEKTYMIVVSVAENR